MARPRKDDAQTQSEIIRFTHEAKGLKAVADLEGRPLTQTAVIRETTGIRRQWIEDADDGNYDDLRSEIKRIEKMGKTIRRALAKMTEEEASLLAMYSWPESHVKGLIPSSGASIGRHLKKVQPKPPSVRQVQWADMLLQSAPDMPWDDEASQQMNGRADEWNVMRLSALLAIDEVIKDARFTVYRHDIPTELRITFWQVVESYIDAAPWRSKADAERYFSENQEWYRGPAFTMESVKILPQTTAGELRHVEWLNTDWPASTGRYRTQQILFQQREFADDS